MIEMSDPSVCPSSTVLSSVPSQIAKRALPSETTNMNGVGDGMEAVIIPPEG